MDRIFTGASLKSVCSVCLCSGNVGVAAYAQPPVAVDRNEWKSLIAIIDMKVPCLGYDGWLYGGWSNEPLRRSRCCAVRK